MSTRQRAFACALSLGLVLAPLARSEHPAPEGTLSVREVYKRNLLPPPPAPGFSGAHLIGQGHIALETEDHKLLICDTADGSILWQDRLADLLQDDRQLRTPAMLHALYESDGGLGLIIVGSGKATYVRRTEVPAGVVRCDMSTLLDSLFSGERLPHRGSFILGVQGGALRQLVHVIDMRTRESVQVLRPKKAKHEITCLAFSHDGKYAAATGDSVYVWDLATGKRINDAYQPALNKIEEWGGYWPRSCAFSRDSSFLAVVTGKYDLLVFDVATAGLLVLQRPPKYWGPVHSVTFLGRT